MTNSQRDIDGLNDDDLTDAAREEIRRAVADAIIPPGNDLERLAYIKGGDEMNLYKFTCPKSPSTAS